MKLNLRFIIAYSLITVITILSVNVLLLIWDNHSKIQETKISQNPVLSKILPIISPEIKLENKSEISASIQRYNYRNIFFSLIAVIIAIHIFTPILIRPITKLSGKAENLNRKTSELVSSVTHELRSPLTSINMYIDLFFNGAAGPLNDTQKEFLNIMKDSSKRLTAFINDLLDLAKIEQGKIAINKQPFDLRSTILEVLELIRPQAHEKKIKLKLVIPSDLPKVFADPEKTKQVITNLVNNSIKFTPEEGNVTVEAKDIKIGYIQVSVIDTGMGIPKDKLDSVFEKFVQVEEAKKNVKGQKGTGLGLAIAKGIVEIQDGKIWIESEPGKGTKFHFTIPRHG